MNILKNILPRLIILTLIIVVLFGSGSCTKKYDDLNVNPTKVSKVDPAEIPFLLSKAQSAATYDFWYYQVGQNLYADQYAQYFACAVNYFPTDRYAMRDDWLQWPWQVTYTQVVPQLKSIFQNTDSTSAENAIAKVWWVWSFHRLTDYFGPIPYFKAGIPATSVPYDSQDLIYDDFFKKLDQAVVVLKTKTAETPYGSYDLIYGGNVKNWIKFANTLRLRLALRISKVDPARAKKEAEAAVASGVLVGGDDALIQRSQNGSDFNGLAVMAPWNEFRMSASMESVLTGYQDPRISEFYSPTLSSGFKEYHGLRNGLSTDQIVNNPKNAKDYNSKLGPRWNSDATFPDAYQNKTNTATSQNVINSAETYFLLAEGALNGWNMGGGTAKDFYEKGISISMKQWNSALTDVQINNYINSTNTPVALSDDVNSPAMSNIPVLFGITPEIQREQIGTQKWIAIFPDGIEGWAEFRRTRFPKLYPIVKSDNSEIPTGSGFIRRVHFINLEKQTNSDEVTKAVNLLKGPDKISTPLWWDKN